MTTAIEDVNLPTVAVAFRSGRADLEALRHVVHTATLYALRPGQPGVLVCEIPDHGRWVLAFSTLEALARFLADRGGKGGPVDWLSTTGADLIEHLPADIGLLIDLTEPHAIALPPAWLGAGP